MSTSLKSLNLKNVYSSTEDDLVNNFYNLVLENAIEYDRITGYFSPKVFALAARGMSKMILNGGKIRIITSVQIDKELYEAIVDPNTLTDNYNWSDFDYFSLEDELERNYLKLFLALLKNGTLELKIALLPGQVGILHEKIGIVRGRDGSALSFSGSNNETVYGWTKNIEHFKVFPEWNSATHDFYSNDYEKFNDYWTKNDINLKIIPVDEAFKNQVLKVNEVKDDIQLLTKRIEQQEKERMQRFLPSRQKLRDLRAYQAEAIELWADHDYRYIFEMATGSGKTFTSVMGLRQFRHRKGILHCVIVVPLTTLVEQWESELRTIIDDVPIIVAAGKNPRWRSDIRSIAQSIKLGGNYNFIIITTYSTFSSNDFREMIDGFSTDDIILLADEMHNLVTENNIRTAVSDRFRYKLGLSATPTRLWRQEQSREVRDIFGSKSYVYSLENAISDESLVNYEYYPLAIHLTIEEYEEYATLSREASRVSHYTEHKENNSLARILTRRAVIKKQAENKFVALERIIDTLRSAGRFDHSLLYVDSNESLTTVQKILTSKFIKSSKFTGDESLAVRNNVMKSLDNEQIEAIVAIKCLDEGVDIPSAKTGIFLSNNTDPREYVQRLGRVLRRHEPSGKRIAYVYDFIVLPPHDVASHDSTARSLVKTEMIRARFFAQLAVNANQVRSTLGEILDIFGFYFEEEEFLSYNESEDHYE